MKNPKEKINDSQHQRAWIFQKTGEKYVNRWRQLTTKTLTFGKTKLRFSEAVAHGSEDSMLGWVIMATIEHKG